MHGHHTDNTVLGWILLLASIMPVESLDGGVTLILHLMQIAGIITGLYYTRRAAKKRE